MNKEEHDQLSQNTNYTKALAYVSVFALVLSAFVVWGTVTVLSDAKTRLEDTESRNFDQDLQISDHNHRLVSVEKAQRRAEQDRADIEEELLQVMRDFKNDLKPVKEYVIRQTAREEERQKKL